MPKQADEPKPKEKRDDIWAMRQCADIIDGLDIVARARVVSYLHTKYMNEALDEVRRRGALPQAPPAKAPAGSVPANGKE